MLVLSSTLVLSPEEAALPTGTPWIGWHSIVAISNVAADSEADGYPVTNLANVATDLQWRSATTVEQYITITTGTADDIDYVGIANHNFGTAGISASVGYFDASSPSVWVELAPEQIFGNDEPIMFRFTAQPLTQVFIKLAAGTLPPQIGVLYVGKLLVLPRGVDVGADFPVPRFARKTTVKLGRSESGHYLGRNVIMQELVWTAIFKHFEPIWYRDNFHPFVLAAQEDSPFFYAWASADYPNEVAFAWFRDDPIPLTSPITGRMHVQLSCGGFV